MIEVSLAHRLQRSLPDLHRIVLAMDDDAFHRAVAAVARCDRRRNREEHPVGYHDASHFWMPISAECTEVVRRARAPTATFPRAYQMVCRSLAHCVELERADYGDAYAVKYWTRLLERELGLWGVDPTAHRSAMKLQQAIDEEPRQRPVVRRARL